MSHLSVSVLQTLKGRLVALRDNALNEARGAEVRDSTLHATTDEEIQDQAERAETQREEEISKVEIANDYGTVDAAEAALQRIADGSYGTCRDCGDAIPQARLLAIPAALRCATCQRAYEQHWASLRGTSAPPMGSAGKPRVSSTPLGDEDSGHGSSSQNG
jgi:RNA polymerase-binding transcription factor DksA